MGHMSPFWEGREDGVNECVLEVGCLTIAPGTRTETGRSR